MGKFVAYYRVSTTKQVQSGLGLDAQRAAVEDYVNGVGGTILAAFREDAASGADRERVELSRALVLCRRKGAMLVVAKLDRLARSVSFITQLMDSGVEFIAADMPDANRLTVHVIAAIAEYERQIISERTKNSLARAKAAGVRLGNPNIRQLQKAASCAAQERADRDATKFARHLRFHDPEDKLPASALANILNAEGLRGPKGGAWSSASISNLKMRLARMATMHTA